MENRIGATQQLGATLFFVADNAFLSELLTC
jgi:hypothetical protein